MLHKCLQKTVDMSTVKQWVMCFSSTDSNVYDKPHSKCSMQTCSLLTKMHGGDYVGKEYFSWIHALSNRVIVFPISAIVSMEINKNHYFWSIPSMYFINMETANDKKN